MRARMTLGGMKIPILMLLALFPGSVFGQVAAATLKIHDALARAVILEVEAVEAADLQRPDKDRATLTQDLERAQRLYAECLRANTTPGKTADQRIMAGARYWEIIGNSGTPTDVIAILEKRSGRAKQVAGIVKRAIPVLEMETDAAERAIWLQRFLVLESSLRTISASPHNASGARFDLKRHTGFFEAKVPVAKTK